MRLKVRARPAGAAPGRRPDQPVAAAASCPGATDCSAGGRQGSRRQGGRQGTAAAAGSRPAGGPDGAADPACAGGLALCSRVPQGAGSQGAPAAQPLQRQQPGAGQTCSGPPGAAPGPAAAGGPAGGPAAAGQAGGRRRGVAWPAPPLTAHTSRPPPSCGWPPPADLQCSSAGSPQPPSLCCSWRGGGVGAGGGCLPTGCPGTGLAAAAPHCCLQPGHHPQLCWPPCRPADPAAHCPGCHRPAPGSCSEAGSGWQG
ncbi:hypothetical protein V8C86DRAFT_360656 [Haematococcus lacustris]